MTVTLTSFRAGYPEFESTPDTLVAAKIAHAELRTSSNAFGTEARRDMAVSLLAAHLLSISPQGEEARINGGAETLYGKELRSLRLGATAGLGRVS